MTDKEYLIQQASLRAKWLDETATKEEREAAHNALSVLVAKHSKPPITGVFTYTEEQVRDSKEGDTKR